MGTCHDRTGGHYELLYNNTAYKVLNGCHPYHPSFRKKWRPTIEELKQAMKVFSTDAIAPPP